MRLALVCLLIALAAPTAAGPWLRDRGAGFLSFSVQATPGGATRMIHADWGLTAGTTVALSGYATADDDAMDLWVTRALPLAHDGQAASYALILRRRGGTSPGLMAGLGLNWGRSLPKGWVAVETLAMTDTADRLAEAKLDVTWGRALRPGLSAMVQLHASHADDRLHATLVPSAIVTLNDRMRLNLGVTQGLTGPVETGAKLGLWLDF